MLEVCRKCLLSCLASICSLTLASPLLLPACLPLLCPTAATISPQIVDALLQHYDPYQPGGDTPLGAGPFLEATPCGSPTSSAAAAASVTSSAAGSRRSSQSGDGMCEIALVVKGVSGSGRVQGSAAKDLSKDGMV
jgi:hypothetical protein